MLTVVYDGVKAYVTPDCAKCLLEGDTINNMNKCPSWECKAEDECDPRCAFYTEDWTKGE